MSGRRLVSLCLGLSLAWTPCFAGDRPLTIDAIFGDTPIEGRLPRDLQWLPGGRDFSYLMVTGSAAEPRVELFLESAESGARRVLLSHDELAGLGAVAEMARARGGSYRWLPGGESIVLAVKGDLYLVGFPGKEVTRLTRTESAEAAPQVSPDGARVAYVRDGDIWVMELATKTETRISRDGAPTRLNGTLDWVYEEELAGPRSGAGFAWSPDSRAILYLSLDEVGVPRHPIVDRLALHPTVEWQYYPTPGDANPVAELRVAQVTAGAGEAAATLSLVFGGDPAPYVPRFGWVPDGSAFWYQRLDRTQTRLELVRVAWPSGEQRLLLAEHDDAWVNLHDDLFFLPDGRFLWSSERDGFRHLYLSSADGRTLRQLTHGKWEVLGVEEVDAERRRVFFAANREHPTRRDLYVVALEDGRLERVTRGDGTHDCEVAPGGRWMVDISSSLGEPERMLVLGADGAPLREVPYASAPSLSEYALGRVETFELAGSPGEAVLYASVLRGKEFDPSRRHPVLVHVYGGPHAQVVRDAWGGRTRLFHEYMASQGVVVFALDNRGSSGRGREFERALAGRFGRVELEDQLRGVAWLTSQPWVDAERIAIWGWSYGGFMTCYAMANAPGVFRTGAAVAPVTDWRLYDSIYTERYLKLPADSSDGYRDSSPVNRADAIKGFLLLAHGTGDDNVHWQNTAALVERLYRAGVPYDLQLYPNLGHGLRGPGAHPHLYRRIAENILYFLRH